MQLLLRNRIGWVNLLFGNLGGFSWCVRGFVSFIAGVKRQGSVFRSPCDIGLMGKHARKCLKQLYLVSSFLQFSIKIPNCSYSISLLGMDPHNSRAISNDYSTCY